MRKQIVTTVEFPNLSVERVVRISARLTAEQWQLYDGPEADRVATKLNDTLAYCVNNGYDHERTEYTMRSIMIDHAAFGAADSDAQRVLERALRAVYGEPR